MWKNKIKINLTEINLKPAKAINERVENIVNNIFSLETDISSDELDNLIDVLNWRSIQLSN